MEISICVKDKNGKKKDVNIDYVKFQKMLFLFNAIDDGWTIKKKEDSYIFKKNHEGKKEVFLETYLNTFMKDNLDIKKLLV
jgi:hypothetical protein